jgi:IS605 OrfB family transposase
MVAIWLSISFRPAEKFVVENKVLGVDLGEKRLFATSENVLFVDKEFNARKRRIRFLKRNLRACKTKSARKKARKVRRKEANMTKQTVHKAVNLILESSANVIAIEDLKGIKKNVFGRNKKKGAFGRKRNNKFSQVPLAQFREVLEYKAGHAGKRVVAVSPANTSKCDYRGLKNGKRKGRRYIGRDGVVLDSDVNAAINIAAKCAEKRELPISFGNFRVPGLDGQAVVNQPNVFKSLHVGVLQAPVL